MSEAVSGALHRRRVLAGFTASAAAALGPQAAVAARSARRRNAGAGVVRGDEFVMKHGRFDVHAHFLLPGQAVAGPPAPGQHFVASPVATWSPEGAIAFMDERGIETQMLSVPGPPSVEFAREANVYVAGLVKRFPGRFGLLAALPMSDIEASLAEIAFAFDELSADGVVIVSNYGGAYLGDGRYDPVFAELHRRKAVIFLHPTIPAGFDCVACGRPGPLIELPFDSCRTVTDMLFNRVFEKYPDMKVIMSHAGGALPTLAPRLVSIGTLGWVPHPPSLTPQTVRAQLSRLYFDTAIAGSTASIGPVLDLTHADHVLFGTDYPPAGVPVIDENIAALDGLTILDEGAKQAIWSNGRRLFPRFCEVLEPQTEPKA